MTPTELKLALATGQDVPVSRQMAKDCVERLAEELEAFTGAIRATTAKLGSDGSFAEAALQVATARRIVEETIVESGDLFDALMWLAGVEVESPRG